MRPSQLQNSSSLHAVNTDPRVSNRVPLERKVVLKFHDFGGFSIEYSANVEEITDTIRSGPLSINLT